MNAKRKRSPAEQDAWDKIEAEKLVLREKKAARDRARDALLNVSTGACEEEGFELLNSYVILRDAVFAAEEKVAGLEASYRDLRSRGGS